MYFFLLTSISYVYEWLISINYAVKYAEIDRLPYKNETCCSFNLCAYHLDPWHGWCNIHLNFDFLIVFELNWEKNRVLFSISVIGALFFEQWVLISISVDIHTQLLRRSILKEGLNHYCIQGSWTKTILIE